MPKPWCAGQSECKDAYGDDWNTITYLIIVFILLIITRTISQFLTEDISQFEAQMKSTSSSKTSNLGPKILDALPLLILLLPFVLKINYDYQIAYSALIFLISTIWYLVEQKGVQLPKTSKDKLYVTTTVLSVPALMIALGMFSSNDAQCSFFDGKGDVNCSTHMDTQWEDSKTGMYTFNVFMLLRCASYFMSEGIIITGAHLLPNDTL